MTSADTPASRPKVLYLITKSNWGGAQRYVHSLAVDARDAGWEVAVAAGGSGRLTEELRVAGIRVVPIPSLTRDVNARADVAAFRDIWRIVRAERPDVLHVNSSKAGSVGTAVGRLLRVPAVIFTAHGWAFNDPRYRRAWQQLVIRALHWLTVLLAHRTIAVAEALVRQLGGPGFVRRRFSVIRNGVEPVALLSRAEARSAIAAASPAAAETFTLAEREGAFVVGVLSELHRVKGLDTLIEALSLLARRYPEVPTVVVIGGEGEERANLERLVAERGLGRRVALVGQIAEAPRRLGAFDCFAMPSRSEALPLALLEAGLAELPAIASRVGGIPEVIEARVSGLLVSPERPRELAEAIRFLAQNRGEATRLGEALGRVVRSRYSRRRGDAETLALYRAELARRTRW